jgi:hypothetical protein
MEVIEGGKEGIEVKQMIFLPVGPKADDTETQGRVPRQQEQVKIREWREEGSEECSRKRRDPGKRLRR